MTKQRRYSDKGEQDKRHRYHDAELTKRQWEKLIEIQNDTQWTIVGWHNGARGPILREWAQNLWVMTRYGNLVLL